MNEKALQTKALAWLRNEFGGVWFKLSDIYTAGLPDILGWKAGQAYAIEVKSPKGSATNLQVHVLNLMAEQGVITAVIHSMNELKGVLNADDIGAVRVRGSVDTKED